MSPELLKVVDRARKDPNARMYSLARLIDLDALKRAFARIRKDAAVGVDGVTKEQYEQNLEENLQKLHERLKSGRYRHQPIRRVHIPKAPGKTRPIGISSIEDKIVQGALTEVLGAIYEQDFSRVRMASGPAAALTTRFAPWMRWRHERGSRGFWRPTSRPSSTVWTAPSWRRCSRYGSPTRHSCDSSESVCMWESSTAGILEAGRGHSAGLHHLTDAGQRVPALRAGHVVRADRQAEAERALAADAVCGRLRDGLREQAGRRMRDGDACPAHGSLRAHAASRQDPPGGLRSTDRDDPAARDRRPSTSWAFTLYWRKPAGGRGRRA